MNDKYTETNRCLTGLRGLFDGLFTRGGNTPPMRNPAPLPESPRKPRAICVRCRFHKLEVEKSLRTNNQEFPFHGCTRLELIDAVSGEPRNCSNARQIRPNAPHVTEEYCGPEGRFYEPKRTD